MFKNKNLVILSVTVVYSKVHCALPQYKTKVTLHVSDEHKAKDCERHEAPIFFTFMQGLKVHKMRACYSFFYHVLLNIF